MGRILKICPLLLNRIDNGQLIIDNYNGRTKVSLQVPASVRHYGLRDFRIRRDKTQCPVIVLLILKLFYI